MSFKPTPYSADAALLSVNINALTIQPSHSEGDDFFGLSAGTNGTAATMRRTCAIACLSPPENAAQLTWVRSNGRAAIGVTYVPTGRELQPEEIEE